MASNPSSGPKNNTPQPKAKPKRRSSRIGLEQQFAIIAVVAGVPSLVEGLLSLVSIKDELIVRATTLAGVSGCLLYQYLSRPKRTSGKNRILNRAVLGFLSLVALSSLISVAVAFHARYTSKGRIQQVLTQTIAATYQADYDTAEQHLREAEQLAADSQWNDAKAYVAACRQEVYLVKGTLNPNGNDFREAQSLALKAESSTNLVTWLWLMQAEHLSKAGNQSNAIEILNEIRSSVPEAARTSYHLTRAIVLRRLGNTTEADQNYTLAKAAATADPAFVLWKLRIVAKKDEYNYHFVAKRLADALLIIPYTQLRWDDGQREPVIWELEDWIAKVPFDSLRIPLQINLGVLHSRMGENALALKAFSAAEQSCERMRSGPWTGRDAHGTFLEYDIALYANYLDVMVKMWAAGQCSKDDIRDISKMLEHARKLLLDSEHLPNKLDRKFVFEIRKIGMQVSSLQGDQKEAFKQIRKIEHEFGLFSGLDADSVATFYVAAVDVVRKVGGENQAELRRLAASAVYWLYKCNRIQDADTLSQGLARER